MEVEEIQNQGCKFPRIGNSRSEKQCPDNEDDDVEVKRNGTTGTGTSFGRLCSWPSSRIVRVSRASGGKDRHSKVWTSKGLRDRRVRLSVPTAIQFYDLQDRLGYDQPSKAVEWLLKAAAGSISELPSINTSFPDTPKQLSDEVEFDGDPNYSQQQHVSVSKSACSSNSETSKGSGLSLSRSESRMKARVRARERTAEREKENHPISQSSFTELLTCGTTSPSHGPSTRQWPSSMDNYFTIPQFNPEMQQHFSFVPDNLNFTISSSSTSGLAGYNRGTLQSNSPSHQRFSLMDGSSSNAPFFMGTTTTTTTAPPNAAAVVVSAPLENHHHQHHHQFPPGLQLYYGGQHSDQKGKGKN